jgi:hypothetical protein
MDAISQDLRHTEHSPLSGNGPSLWREVADGSAGPVVRAGVSIALAPLLAGAGLLGSWVIAGWVPDRWAHQWNGRSWPGDELVGATMSLSGVAYVVALIWIWRRGRYRLHEFFKAALLTLVVAAVVALLGWIIVESRALSAAFEILMGGVVCLGIGAVILIWVQAGRRFVRRKPLHDPADGAIDVRCPSCGYRMVGLREGRCPECGSAFTLDELIARQRFFMPRLPLGVISPAMASAQPPDGNGSGTAA